MSNAPNQFKASSDGEGEVYVPLTKNIKNMDLYDVKNFFNMFISKIYQKIHICIDNKPTYWSLDPAWCMAGTVKIQMISL